MESHLLQQASGLLVHGSPGQPGQDAEDPPGRLAAQEDPWSLTGQHRDIIKLGASYQRVSSLEQRWFAAGAAAAQQTGAPIAIHTEIGTATHAILDLLERHGVPPHRVMLAHTDRNPDPELHLDLIARGTCLVYDTIGRIKYRPDSVVLDLIEHIAAAGKLDHLCLGTDVGRKSTFNAYGGGPGMDVLGREFIPRLQRRIGQDGVTAILQGTPQAFLARPAPDCTAHHATA